MNRFILLLFVASICSACNENSSNHYHQEKQHIPQTRLSKTAASLSNAGDTLFQNKEKYSGYVYTLYANTSDTASLESYYNGLLSGVTKKWYPNKMLMEHRTYLNGMKNGLQSVFWENGKKKFEFTAVNDRYEGELKEWNEDGLLIHLATYKKRSGRRASETLV